MVCKTFGAELTQVRWERNKIQAFNIFMLYFSSRHISYIVSQAMHESRLGLDLWQSEWLMVYSCIFINTEVIILAGLLGNIHAYLYMRRPFYTDISIREGTAWYGQLGVQILLYGFGPQMGWGARVPSKSKTYFSSRIWSIKGEGFPNNQKLFFWGGGKNRHLLVQ